jgi:hypothetical protein
MRSEASQDSGAEQDEEAALEAQSVRLGSVLRA